jgi:hypothetical protein
MAMLRHLGTRPIHLLFINPAWGWRARHVRLSRCQDGARETQRCSVTVCHWLRLVLVCTGTFLQVIGAALNAMTLAMAIELESTGIKVNAVSPGFTKTNLNNYAGTETVEEGAREAVRVALLGPDGPTGTFTHAKLGTLQW